MILFRPSIRMALLVSLYLIWVSADAQMIGAWSSNQRILQRQNGNNNRNGQNDGPNTSAFNIVNGRVFTPGLGIILAVRLAPVTSFHPILTPTDLN
jgi:hypothetical protein